MTDAADQLPDDLASTHAMILAERAARRQAQALAARAQAVNSHSDASIARLRLEIEKLKRDIHGSRSERKAAPRPGGVAARRAGSRRQRRRRWRRGCRLSGPSSASAQRASPSPSICRVSASSSPPRNCLCCGSAKLAKLGEDVTETLPLLPSKPRPVPRVDDRRWMMLRILSVSTATNTTHTQTGPTSC